MNFLWRRPLPRIGIHMEAPLTTATVTVTAAMAARSSDERHARGLWAKGVPPAEVEQRTVQRAGSPHQQGAFPPGLSEPCPAHCHSQPAGGVAGGGNALLCESSGCAACEECALVEEEAAAEEEESGGEECRCDRSHPQCGRDGWRGSQPAPPSSRRGLG